jgi:O-methyltransferase involved in polyketide biosynthesis
MRTTLKQRHTMLDTHLEQLIQQYPNLQVLEIACGLSPRGWWFRQHHPDICYRELDLPDMAATKQAALQQIEPHVDDVLSVDLFTEAFANVFKVFDPKRPLVIISEGLINYFEKPLLHQFILIDRASFNFENYIFCFKSLSIFFGIDFSTTSESFPFV